MEVNKIIKKLEIEAEEIDNAMCCDDTISSFSFAYSQAEERLEQIKKEIKQLKKLF